MKPIYLRIFAFCVIVFGLFGSGFVFEPALARKIQATTLLAIVLLIFGGYFQFSRIFRSRISEAEEKAKKDEFNEAKSHQARSIAFLIFLPALFMLLEFPKFAIFIGGGEDENPTKETITQDALFSALIVMLGAYLIGRVIVWLKYR